MLLNFLRNKNCVNRNSFRNSTLYKFLIKIYFESFAYISFSTDKLKNIKFGHQCYHSCNFGAVLVQSVWNVFHYLPTYIVECVSECFFFKQKRQTHKQKAKKSEENRKTKETKEEKEKEDLCNLCDQPAKRICAKYNKLWKIFLYICLLYVRDENQDMLM